MYLDGVQNHFNTEAFEYDGLIPKLIPKYHEQNEVIALLIPFQKQDSIKILDLGCGTGVLSYIALNCYQQSQVVAFDLADNMLRACEQNLFLYKNRLTLKQGNFATDDLGKDYDLVLSGLAVHHLNDSEKFRLFKRIFEALKPEGMFINRDIVLGPTDYLTDLYHSLWRQFIRSNGEDDQKWFKTYLREDIPAAVEDQLAWLKAANFSDVDCNWRYLNYAIFSGRKPKISDYSFREK